MLGRSGKSEKSRNSGFKFFNSIFYVADECEKIGEKRMSVNKRKNSNLNELFKFKSIFNESSSNLFCFDFSDDELHFSLLRKIIFKYLHHLKIHSQFISQSEIQFQSTNGRAQRQVPAAGQLSWHLHLIFHLRNAAREDHQGPIWWWGERRWHRWRTIHTHTRPGRRTVSLQLAICQR